MRISDFPLCPILKGTESIPILDPTEVNVEDRNKRVLLNQIMNIPGPTGPGGKSAYNLWIEAGNAGGMQEFLASLRGPAGSSAYELWSNDGHSGSSLQDFLSSLVGPAGRSAYQIWQDLGNEGTVLEYIESIRGPQGNDGVKGNRIFNGPNNPIKATGSNGDYYIKTSDGKLFHKANGLWNNSIITLKGSYWNIGTVVPNGSIGSIGDYYLNISTGNIYGPKTDFGWGNYVGNLKGTQGVPGNPGPQGPKGTIGTPGALWYSSLGIPVVGLGINNDCYIDGNTGNVYRKISGAWQLTAVNLRGPQGPAGPAGSFGNHGTIWYAGTGVPSNTVGLNNDYYLDRDNGDVYQKNSDLWSSPILNIKGPAGANGITGNTGPQGVQGVRGTIWYSSAGVPSSGLGSNGDYYLNTNTGDVYTKTSNTWGSPVTNIKGPQGADGTGGGGGSTGGFTTGDVKYSIRTTPETGWILSSTGKTIGNGSSGATNRANADCHDLFVLIWNNFPTAQLYRNTGESDVVSAGDMANRASNAEIDWAANARIRIPEFNRRLLAATGIPYSNTTGFTALTSKALGSVAGEETHILTVSEMPAHTHGVIPYSGNTGTNVNQHINSATNGASYTDTSSTGGSQAHNTLPPTMYINLMIKL